MIACGTPIVVQAALSLLCLCAGFLVVAIGVMILRESR